VSTFSKGLIPNSPDVIKKQPTITLYPSKVVLPSAFALQTPPIADQKNTEECATFSSAYAILGFYNGASHTVADYDKVGSPEFLFSYYKKINHDSFDIGCQLFSEGTTTGLAEILQKVGTCSWNQMPFINNINPIVPSTIQVGQALVNAVPRVVKISNDDCANPDILKKHIASGRPIWICVAVDDYWQNANASFIWKTKGAHPEGHVMAITGWDDAKNAYKVQNSWGTNWGDAGFGWIDYQFFPTLIKDWGPAAIIIPNAKQQQNLNSMTSLFTTCSQNGTGSLAINNTLTNDISIQVTAASTTTTPTQSVSLTISAGKESVVHMIPAGAQVIVSGTNVSTGAALTLVDNTVTIVQCVESKMTIK
jgi:hypothetical protein